MTKKRELYVELASLVTARLSCEKSGNSLWFENHSDRIEKLVTNYMPSGSGIDCGTTIDLEKSKPEKLVFTMSFHHMSQSGMYDGWTDHTVTVTPSLQFGFNLSISGRNRHSIKEYLYEIYDFTLRQLINN